jgi:hypothetical protein
MITAFFGVVAWDRIKIKIKIRIRIESTHQQNCHVSCRVRLAGDQERE